MKLPDRNAISDEIRRLMDEKKVQNAELGKAVGVSTVTVSHIRRGSASYELLKKTIETLDSWEANK